MGGYPASNISVRRTRVIVAEQDGTDADTKVGSPGVKGAAELWRRPLRGVRW